MFIPNFQVSIEFSIDVLFAWKNGTFQKCIFRIFHDFQGWSCSGPILARAGGVLHPMGISLGVKKPIFRHSLILFPLCTLDTLGYLGIWMELG